MNLISRAMFATPISFCFCFSRSIQSVLWKLGLLIFEQNKKIEWGFHHFYQHNCWSVCTSNLDAVKLYINLKMAVQLMLKFSFYRTRVRSLVMLVSDSLTHSLTHSLLFSKLDGLVWSQLLDDVANIYAACKDDNSNLLRLLLLLMLMMRNVLTTVCCRFGRWSLVLKLSFCSDLEHKVSRFGQDFEVDVQARF